MVIFLSVIPAFSPTYLLCGSGSVFGIRIRIHKVAEYGSNLDKDPDPQHCVKPAN